MLICIFLSLRCYIKKIIELLEEIFLSNDAWKVHTSSLIIVTPYCETIILEQNSQPYKIKGKTN